MSDKSAPEISPIMRRLSSYIASALRGSVPPAVVEKTKHHLLDTIAAMVSGSRLEPGKTAIAYIQTLGGTREASVIGSRILTTAVNALALSREIARKCAPRSSPSCAAQLSKPLVTASFGGYASPEASSMPTSKVSSTPPTSCPQPWRSHCSTIPDAAATCSPA